MLVSDTLPEAPQRNAADIERRRLTVMFVDILEATELIKRAGIERAYATVTECLRVLEGVARRHGGVVDKYLSDCLMAVFGGAAAAPEAAVEAVAAGVEMLEAVERFATEVDSPIPLTLRIGINTGLVISGGLRGRVVREFAVMGDPVNVAARLKDVGEPGGIHIGPETHEAAAAHFECEAGTPLTLRGKTQPVPAYRVIATALGGRRARGSAPPLVDTPLFGRVDERARLAAALVDTARGRGRTIVIRGEEGLGKSRLVTEVCTAASAQGATVVSGRALRAQRERALHVVANLLDDWVGIGHADDVEAVRAKAAAAAPRFPGVHPAALADALGDGSSESRAAALLPALAAGIQATTAPLVIACEDLQWADAASLEAIAALARASADRPVLWLLTARADASVLESRLAGHGETLVLGPLAPEDAARLVDHVTGGAALAPDVRARIDERAGGNPYRLILSGRLADALATEIANEAGAMQRATDTERRRVTVLFADITGFTRMSEQLPPAESYRAVSGCLAILHEVAVKHGGSVEKYMGDCIFAVFGAPVAIEDAPRAAVNAAIEMRRRVRTYNSTARLQSPLDIHVGINTGLGVAGDVSGALLREFTLMGESVSVASKLKDIAPAGRIWVGRETHRATRSHFEYTSVDGGAFEVRSEREQLHRVNPADVERTLFTAMVGREAELGALREALAAVATGIGAIATITAEAGLGKSRLVREALRLPEARDVTAIEACSLSMGGSLPYHPFVDLLRNWAKIDDDDADEVGRRKLETLLSGLLGERTAELRPFLARLMGLALAEDEAERLADIDAEGIEKLIARSVREVLVAGATARPLLLAFEDVHWADLSSIQLLLGLLPLARKHPILFLLAARPDYDETSGRLLAACRERFARLHTELTLSRLNERECGLLIRGLIRHDRRSHTTRALILSRADGNPFFIEEVIRTLIDEGAIVAGAQGLEVTARIDEVEVPGTIQEVIMARVDRLAAHARDLLQRGSVLGRTFPLRLLNEVSPRADAEQTLAQLVERDLLETSVTGGEAGFAFKHALAQETVYESILQTTRRRLHAEVGAAIERLFEDRLPDYYGMLAYHYGRAEDLVKTTEYLMKAGDVAESVAASSEALAYFREAARLYDVLHGDQADPDMQAVLDKRIGMAYLNKGDLPSALDHFDLALAHLGETDPATTPQTVRRLASDLGAVLFHVYLRGGRPRPTPPDARTRTMIEIIFHKGKVQSTSAPQGYVLSMLRGIRRLGEVDPSRIDQASVMYAATSALFAYSGTSFGLSARFLPMSKALVRNVRDDLGYRAMAFLHYYLVGDWRDEHTIDDALIEEGLRYGDFWEVNTYLGLECERLICQGRTGEAHAIIARLARIHDDYGYGFARSNADFMIAYLQLQERDLAAAARSMAVYYEGRSEQSLFLLALGVRAEIETLAGDLTAARATSAEAEEIANRLGRQGAPYYSSPHYLSRWLLALELWERAPHLRPSRRHLSRLARVAVGIGSKIARERPKALRLMARHSWLLGRRRAALRWWARALTECERLGARPDLARTYGEAAERLRGTAARVNGLDAAALAEHEADVLAELARLRGGETHAPLARSA